MASASGRLRGEVRVGNYGEAKSLDSVTVFSPDRYGDVAIVLLGEGKPIGFTIMADDARYLANLILGTSNL